MDRLDLFVDKLQETIFDEAREAFGENGFQRWRNPRFHGRMKNPHGSARVTGDCGDTMEIYLQFENNRVKKASYFTDGCASSGIAGSFAAELALGKDPDTLADMTGAEVLAAIGRLPPENEHCADLAAATVREAVGRYIQKNLRQKKAGNLQ